MVLARQRLYISIIIFIIITVAGVSPAFSLAEVTFGDAERVEGQDTIQVPVLISGFESAGIDGFVLRIDYDDGILKNGRCNEFETGSPSDGIGKLSVALMSGLSIPADGTLLTLEFDHDGQLPETLSFSFASPDDKTVLFKEGFVKVETNYTNNTNVKVPPPPCSATCSVQTQVAPEQGTISPSGKSNFSCGDTQTYTFEAKACFKIEDVSLAGKSLGQRSSYTFECKQEDNGQNHILELLLERKEKTLNIETAGNGAVYAIPPDGEKKLGASEKFPCGLPQTLRLVPSDHYELGEVFIDGAPPAISEENTIIYTPNDDDQPHTLYVKFVPMQTRVDLTVVGNGAICSPPGSADPIALSTPFVLPFGQDGNFEFVPAPCYAIGEVVADGAALGAVSEHIIPNDGKPHTLSVTFVQKQMTLSITKEGDGDGDIFDISDTETPLGDAKTFPCGESQTLKLVPAPCYEVSEVFSGMDIEVSPDEDTVTFTLADDGESSNLNVRFAQKQMNLTITTEGDGDIFDISDTETPLGDAKKFPCGESQTLKLVPAPYYKIAEARLDDNTLNVSTEDNTITFKLGNADVAPHLHVVFVRKQTTINITKEGEGDISDISSDTKTALEETGTFVCGLPRTIELVPAPCYEVAEARLGDNALDVSPENTVTFALADGGEPPALSVTFTRKQTNLNIRIEEGEGNVYALPDETIPLDLSFPKFSCGLTQLLKIAPDECYRIEEVRLDNNIVELLPDDFLEYTPGDDQEEHILEIRFARKQFTITTNVQGNAVISPSGEHMVTCGTDVQYTIEHLHCDTRQTLEDVLADGVSVRSHLISDEDKNAYLFVLEQINADHIIEVRFSDTCSTPVQHGTVRIEDSTCIVTPDSCYRIGDVLVQDTSVMNRMVFEEEVGRFGLTTDDKTSEIRPVFTRKTYTATATAETGGIISPAGESRLNCGTDYVYTILPDKGYGLGDVQVNGVSVMAELEHPDSATGSYRYTLNREEGVYAIDASFSPKTYSLHTEAAAGGSVSPAGQIPVVFGESQTITIEPETCHKIQDVMLDGRSVMDELEFTGDTARFTLMHVSTDHRLEALFSPKTYAITTQVGEGGHISSAGGENAVCDTDQTFEVTPLSGWTITDVRLDGQSVISDLVQDGESFRLTLYQIHANHLIEAEFAPIPSPPPENQSPEISGKPSGSATAGEFYTFTPQASDPDGDSLTFTITYKPDWATFDPDSGTLNGTPGAEDVGNPAQGIVITVTDSQGLSASLPAFDLTVQEKVQTVIEPSDNGNSGGGGGGCFIGVCALWNCIDNEHFGEKGKDNDAYPNQSIYEPTVTGTLLSASVLRRNLPGRNYLLSPYRQRGALGNRDCPDQPQRG